jgi:hypothetical protein
MEACFVISQVSLVELAGMLQMQVSAPNYSDQREESRFNEAIG